MPGSTAYDGACTCGGLIEASPTSAFAEPAPRCYRIVRFYAPGRTYRRPRTIRTGLTLAEAQAHCSDPSTRVAGSYFDGYDWIKGCAP